MSEPSGDAPGYAAAMQELEGILTEIEADDVDIDVLSDRVRRAAELIELCRTRIEKTRIEVEDIVTNLTGSNADEVAE